MTRTTDLRAIDAAVTMLSRVGHSHRARRRIEERSGVPVGPVAVAILASLRALGPSRHGAVARRLGVQPSRMSKEIRALVDAGLVDEQPDPQDRRAVLLRLTADGADSYRRYRRAAEEAVADALDDWSDRDVERLALLITRLADAFAMPRDG